VTATKSWGPTPTEKLGREVANQVAAPTEARTPTKHRANIAHKECGWKDGDRGGLAEWEQIHGMKKCKCALTSTGLLMEGVGLPSGRAMQKRSSTAPPRTLRARTKVSQAKSSSESIDPKICTLTEIFCTPVRGSRFGNFARNNDCIISKISHRNLEPSEDIGNWNAVRKFPSVPGI